MGNRKTQPTVNAIRIGVVHAKSDSCADILKRVGKLDGSAEQTRTTRREREAVHFVNEPDFAFNPIGARGMGEIGITGMAAAVANAVYHATGKRIRELPITLDKLM